MLDVIANRVRPRGPNGQVKAKAPCGWCPGLTNLDHLTIVVPQVELKADGVGHVKPDLPTPALTEVTTAAHHRAPAARHNGGTPGGDGGTDLPED